MSDQITGVLQSTRWYNGYWENQDLMNDGQFQYGRNIDIFNDISWIQLASKIEQTPSDPPPSNRVVAYAPYDNNKLFRFMDNRNFNFTNNATRPSSTSAGTTTNVINSTAVFRDEVLWVREPRIFAFSANAVEIIDPDSPYTVTSIVPTDGTFVRTSWSTQAYPLVYSGSVLLVGKWNILRRYVPIGSPELPVWWKAIRVFKEWDQIVWLTVSGNYLKIWINERNINTKILYVTGTFDAEDWWVINTIEWDNMVCLWAVCTISNVDYALMRSSTDNTIVYFYSIDWYTKSLIRRTKFANGQANQLEYFTVGWDTIKPQIKRDIAYMPMGDGIWTFGMNKLWQPTMNLQRWSTWLVVNRSQVFWDYLYTAGNFPINFEQRVYLEYRNNWYISSTGIVTDKVEIWDFIKEQKENLELVVEYELDQFSASPWTIEIYIRPNRANRTATWWFTLVDTITDKTRLVHRVAITKLGLKSDWDTMEVQYRLIAWTDPLVSPILRQRWLFYTGIDKPNGR